MAAVVDNREIPDICLQHMMAVMLVDKTVSFKAAHDKPRMQDAAVLRQRAKVQLVKDEELEQLLPVRVAVVEVTLSDGTRSVGARRGGARHPAQPDDAQEVVAKARDLVDPVLGAATGTRLVETIFSSRT